MFGGFYSSVLVWWLFSSNFARHNTGNGPSNGAEAQLTLNEAATSWNQSTPKDTKSNEKCCASSENEKLKAVHKLRRAEGTKVCAKRADCRTVCLWRHPKENLWHSICRKRPIESKSSPREQPDEQSKEICFQLMMQKSLETSWLI